MNIMLLAFFLCLLLSEKWSGVDHFSDGGIAEVDRYSEDTTSALWMPIFFFTFIIKLMNMKILHYYLIYTYESWDNKQNYVPLYVHNMKLKSWSEIINTNAHMWICD